MTKRANNAPRPATTDRSRIGAHELRRVVVWTEILGKPVSRRLPRFPR